MGYARELKQLDTVLNSGFRNCFECGEKFYAMVKMCMRCEGCRLKRSAYHKKYNKRMSKVKEMDAKIKTAQKQINDKLKGAEKTEKKEFKGLLKEDKKLDAQRDKLKAQVAQKKK